MTYNNIFPLKYFYPRSKVLRKNPYKRATNSSLKDTLPSSNTFTLINKGKTIKSKAYTKINKDIIYLETYLRYASEYTLFPKLKYTLAPNSITSKNIDYIKKGRSYEDITLKVVIKEKLVINSNTKLSSSIILAIAKASRYTLRAIAKLKVNKEEVADKVVDTTN
ncbi:uncharacterized protein RAG0_17864 [Rhynchosporium agropyri]|uniref:Uncharacterized protein n=1 Tax=Rhynchosporium agropyri TaxID=914238 RepID=A0A1E1LU39_9HELO|nr:uncharacterized protein RAG0_17864 [Rhynchosporium agropyri]